MRPRAAKAKGESDTMKLRKYAARLTGLALSAVMAMGAGTAIADISYDGTAPI